MARKTFYKGRAIRPGRPRKRTKASKAQLKHHRLREQIKDGISIPSTLSEEVFYPDNETVYTDAYTNNRSSDVSNMGTLFPFMQNRMAQQGELEMTASGSLEQESCFNNSLNFSGVKEETSQNIIYQLPNSIIVKQEPVDEATEVSASGHFSHIKTTENSNDTMASTDAAEFLLPNNLPDTWETYSGSECNADSPPKIADIVILDFVKQEPVEETTEACTSVNSTNISITENMNDTTPFVNAAEMIPDNLPVIQEVHSSFGNSKDNTEVPENAKLPLKKILPSYAKIQDERSAFGEFVVSQLREMPNRHTELLARRRITNILTKLQNSSAMTKTFLSSYYSKHNFQQSSSNSHIISTTSSNFKKISPKPHGIQTSSSNLNQGSNSTYILPTTSSNSHVIPIPSTSSNLNQSSFRTYLSSSASSNSNQISSGPYILPPATFNLNQKSSVPYILQPAPSNFNQSSRPYIVPTVSSTFNHSSSPYILPSTSSTTATVPILTLVTPNMPPLTYLSNVIPK